MKHTRLRSFLLLFLCFVIFMTGCQAGSSDKNTSSTEKKDYNIEITDDIQKIIDRGYLIVGCKTDVPGFGYYNAESKTWSGMEVDLAYQLAGKIFDTTPEKAKRKN